MNAFMSFMEVSLQECSLSKLAKDMSNKLMDINELDKPISFADTNDNSEKKTITDEEKQKIKEETGWSDEIIDEIGSIEEYNIYKEAGLEEVEIDGKKCLVRSDLDLDQKDDFGVTNRERMANGHPPITTNGETVELHHIGQKKDSPLAEVTTQEHRGKGNDTILHDKSKESEIDRNEFGKERASHWRSRANENE